MKKTYPTYEEAQRIVQEKGVKTASEYFSCFKELGLPAEPFVCYKEKGWVDWYDFLGRTKVEYPSYDEAQRIVQEKGIKTAAEYRLHRVDLGLPSSPHKYYKGKGWIDYYNFLGTQESPFPTYEEAQKLVQENGIKSQEGYKLVYKSLGLPGQPCDTYKNKGWTNWYDFFGKEGRSYPTYEKAQRIVQEKGVKTANEYFSCSKELGLPSQPEIAYKDKGWVNWYDFLGKSKMISQEDRKYNLFKKFAINPVLLKDAPLKVLYIYFSKFRGITDGITSLLATSSYEERLNWVKEQLNSLKDGSLSKGKSSEDPDELSAMESVLEENDDVKESLSGEDAERFIILLENYVHSVVNRELISEVDDK